MDKHFNKGLFLTGLGSFWWGFIGVIYFEAISFIGYIEVIVHRCLWTAVALLITTTFFFKWDEFLKTIKVKKNLFNLFIDGYKISQLFLFEYGKPSKNLFLTHLLTKYK